MLKIHRRSLLCAQFLLSACGTNRPEIPDDLRPIACVGSDAAAYPAGPYGTGEGDVIEDFGFSGWRDPKAVSYGGPLEGLHFSDYYDPSGARFEILVINTAAGWCMACREEHRTLPSWQATWAADGLVVFGVYFQNALRAPPTAQDLSTWTEAMQTTFPMAIDPDFRMAAFASAESAPLNLVVDARTMRVLRKVVGYQPEVVAPYVEAALVERRSR